MLRSQTARRRRCLCKIFSSCPRALSADTYFSLDTSSSHALSIPGHFLSETDSLFQPGPALAVQTDAADFTSRPIKLLPLPIESRLWKLFADDEQVLERRRAQCAHFSPDAARRRRVERDGYASGRPRACSSKAYDDSLWTPVVEEITSCAGDQGAGTKAGKGIADVAAGNARSSCSPNGQGGDRSDRTFPDSSHESDLSDIEIMQPQDIRVGTEISPQKLEEMQTFLLREEIAITEGSADSRGGLDVLESVELSSTTEDSPEAFIPDVEENASGPPYLHTLSLDEAYRILEKARAKDLRHVQVGDKCEWVDCMIFASGRSLRHIRGMADALVYSIKKSSRNVGSNSLPTVEGRDGEQWMVVDCGSLVIHLFVEEARSYFNLEEFWRSKTGPAQML